MKPFHRLLLLLTLLVPVVAPAQVDTLAERLGQLFGNDETILPPQQAFRLTVDDSNPARLQLYWDIADGYYLYHDKFAVRTNTNTVAVSELDIPNGTIESDPEFGDVEVYYDDVTVTAALSRAAAEPGSFNLEVHYQGCKKGSVCYPPQTEIFPMSLAPVANVSAAEAIPPTPPASRQGAITNRLVSGGLLANIAAFFGFGLLLSLTPCVFPMIPILSGLIVGQAGDRGQRTSAFAGLLLSLAYVLAMALTYALLGVVAASFHFNLQAAAQNVWVLIAFAGVFVLLALSMFGFYELELPAGLRDRLHAFSQRQRGGNLAGAAVMGAVSALIVGPCVAPPLAGALLYISQTGDALLGGAALFAMGLGFGVPLLVIGVAGGRLLPAAGSWMEVIKQVFGVIMLGVAVWFLGRILPSAVTLILWALLAIVSAVYMGALDRLDGDVRWQRLWKGLGLALLVYGVILILAAVSGGRDPLRPLQDSMLLAGRDDGASVEQAGGELPFVKVKTVADVRAAILDTALQGRPLMLDFSADWCVICQELELYTFRDPQVHAALEDFVLIQADVTANDAADRELLQKYGLFGPPAMLFFNREGKEVQALRLVGFIDADEFVDHVAKLAQPSTTLAQP